MLAAWVPPPENTHAMPLPPVEPEFATATTPIVLFWILPEEVHAGLPPETASAAPAASLNELPSMSYVKAEPPMPVVDNVAPPPPLTMAPLLLERVLPVKIRSILPVEITSV